MVMKQKKNPKKRKMKRLLNCSLFLTIFLLSSCSAQWHLKQAIKKDPGILKPNTVLFDTLVVIDSFTNIDTFTLNEVDTFISDTGKLKITLYKFKNRYILKTEKEIDTIEIKKEIQCPPSVIQVKEDYWRKCMYSFLIGSLLTTVLLSLYYAKKLDNTKPDQS